MNSNDILFVGIGQAGNNLTSAVTKVNKRITGLYINTSEEDLKSIPNAKRTFVVPGASGTGRNRAKAKEYVKDQVYALIDLLNQYSTKKHIYFAFSMGGGTGSGIAPMLLAVLSKQRADLKINLVPILPFSKDSKKAFENTLECWNEVVKLPNINTVYLIDNNRREGKSSAAINKEFADLFNTFLTTTDSHADGVLDGAEIEILANAPGLSALYKLDNYVENNKKAIAEEISKSMFVVGSAKCEYLGISVPEGTDTQTLLDIYNIQNDYFVGYSDKNPILIVSGVKITANAVSNVKDTLNLKNASIKSSEEEEEEEVAITVEYEVIKKATPATNKQEKVEEVSIDDLLENEDDFWNDIMNM